MTPSASLPHLVRRRGGREAARVEGFWGGHCVEMRGVNNLPPLTVCHLHRSRATRQGGRAVGVARLPGRGRVGRGAFFFFPSSFPPPPHSVLMGDHTKLPDRGSQDPGAASFLLQCFFVSFNTLLISFIRRSDGRFHAQRRGTQGLGGGYPGRRLCRGVSRPTQRPSMTGEGTGGCGTP